MAGTSLVQSCAKGFEFRAGLDHALRLAAAQIDPDSSVRRRILDQEASASDRIDAAVSSTLVADVPLGAFISGGIDSSAIVASMVGFRSPRRW